jgi:hypothetical protein
MLSNTSSAAIGSAPRNGERRDHDSTSPSAKSGFIDSALSRRPIPASGAPVAYEVDGTEYIAVQSGWGVDAERIQDKLAKANIGVSDNVPQGGVGLGIYRWGGCRLLASASFRPGASAVISSVSFCRKAARRLGL